MRRRRDGRRRRRRDRPRRSRSRRWCGSLHESMDAGRARLLVVAGRGPHRRRRPARCRRAPPAPRSSSPWPARCATTRARRSSSSPRWARSAPDRIELMADMSLAADRPLNWNLLGSLSPTEIYEQQLTSCDRADRRRARTVVALDAPRPDAHARAAGILEDAARLARGRRAARRRAAAARSRTPRCAGGSATAPTRPRAAGSARWPTGTCSRSPRSGRRPPESRRRRPDRSPQIAAEPRHRPGRRAASTSCSPTGCRSRSCSRRSCRRSARSDESWEVRAGVWARRPGRARRLRRRRAPRPHVPRQLHDRRARRARCATAGLLDAGGGRPPAHRRARPPATGSATAGRIDDGWHADLVVFDPDRIGQPGRTRCATTCPAAASASTPRPSASSTCSSVAGPSWSRVCSPARCPVRCCGPVSTPTPSRFLATDHAADEATDQGEAQCLTLEESRSSPGRVGASARRSRCTSPGPGTTSPWPPAPCTRARRGSTRRRSSARTPHRCRARSTRPPRCVVAEGRQAMPVFLDITDRTTLGSSVTTVLERWGRIDVLVNNARYIGPGHMDRLLDTPVELLDKHLEAQRDGPDHPHEAGAAADDRAQERRHHDDHLRRGTRRPARAPPARVAGDWATACRRARCTGSSAS